MTLKSYLWGMRIGALAAFGAWLMILLYVDPEKSGPAGQALFFGATLLFLSGIFVLFFTWTRRKIGGDDEMALAYLGASFRQGILISLLVVLLLVLQQYRILTWWDGSLVVVGIFLVELFFLTRR